MLNFLNRIRIATRITVVAALSVLFSCFVVYSAISNRSTPYRHQLQKDSNISKHYPVARQKAIKRSRESAVQVLSMNPYEGFLSTFSGTYFESFGGYFIITVAHGIQGPCEHTKVLYDGDVYDCKKYITVDNQIDYAIIQIDKMYNRRAIKIPRDIPNNKQWTLSYSILNKLVYTGYPNTIGPLTISGDVAGFAASQYIYMISYAWQGSSGSGVFDSNGKFVGHVVAVDVGQTEFGFQILQNVVLVVPAFKIDWTRVITESE